MKKNLRAPKRKPGQRVRYAAFHDTEAGYPSKKAAQAWIDRHARENDGEETRKAWRVMGVVEL